MKNKYKISNNRGSVRLEKVDDKNLNINYNEFDENNNIGKSTTN